MEVPGGVERRRHCGPLAVHAQGRRVAVDARARCVPGCVRRHTGVWKEGAVVIRPDDRDDAMRELLRQPRPSADDAVRAARVYRAVHAAWRDTADRPRYWGRGVALTAAAGLGHPSGPTPR